MPVLTSFLPPTHTHLYLPALLQIWQAFNSHSIDDRMLGLVGSLSVEHVGGKTGHRVENGGAEYKDVGIWSHDEWTMLMGKCLASMSMSQIGWRSARFSCVFCRCSRRRIEGMGRLYDYCPTRLTSHAEGCEHYGGARRRSWRQGVAAH